MYQDEELHAKLLKVFREYFEANQVWINEGTKASAIRLRKKLSEIRKICSQRRVVVREWIDWKEERLEERKQRRKQNDQTD
jgi:uncharacterized protein (DUF2344 family)